MLFNYSVISYDACFIIISYKYVVMLLMYAMHLCNTYIKIYIICIHIKNIKITHQV